MAEPIDEPEVEAEEALDQANPAAVAIALGRVGRKDKGLDEDARAFLRKQGRLLDLQTEHLHEQRELQLAHLKVRRWKDRLSLALQGLGVAVGASALLGLGVIAWRAHEDHSLTIEAFSTPPDLARQGLSGDALASELMDRLSEINQVVRDNSITASNGVKTDRSQDVKVEIPETGVSLGEIGRLLRDWLGSERKVEGELRQTADGRLVLTARMAGRAFSASGLPSDLDKLEQLVAEQIFAADDESNYVIYLDATGRQLEGSAKAQRMVRAGSLDALSLWATELYELDPVRGLAVSRMAVRVSPLSTYSHFELLREELNFGHDEGALTEAQRLLERLNADRNPGLRGRGGDILRTLAQSTIARLRGDDAMTGVGYARDARASQLQLAQDAASTHDLKRARELLDEALASGAEDNAYLARTRYAIDAEAGDWRAAATDAATAMARVDADAAKDPASGGREAFAKVEAAKDLPRLALAQAEGGDLAAATKSAEQTPLDCYACLRARGRIAAMAGDRAGSERWFAEAARQGPSLPRAYADWGSALLMREDVDGAIAKLALAHQRGPRFADPLELWGEALMKKGDYAGAAARFAEADMDAPRWGRNHLEWGEALMLAGHYRQARVQLELASGLEISRPDRAALNVLLERTAAGTLHG